MLVSVVIPMYNAANSIISTLNSVKEQTYKNLEIIIVNDGSTDLSGQIVEEYILKNPKLAIKHFLQKNSGVSVARNFGLKKANGSWVALLDSDDQWLPNKLQRQIEVVSENPDIFFLGTARNGEIIKSSMLKGHSTLFKIEAKQLLLKMFFITPTVIFKKEILNEVNGFPENQHYCEDGNFFIRICKSGHSYFLNESLVVTGGGKAHFGETGLSSNLWNMQKGELMNIKLALKLGIINAAQFPLYITFSMFKYFRRVFIVKKKKIIKAGK